MPTTDTETAETEYSRREKSFFLRVENTTHSGSDFTAEILSYNKVFFMLKYSQLQSTYRAYRAVFCTRFSSFSIQYQIKDIKKQLQTTSRIWNQTMHWEMLTTWKEKKELESSTIIGKLKLRCKFLVCRYEWINEEKMYKNPFIE